MATAIPRPPSPTDTYGEAREAARAKGGHEADQRLRRFGFVILARPRGGEPIWERGRRRYTQAEAERWVAREVKRVEQNR